MARLAAGSSRANASALISRRQSGVALITVLLITAILVGMTTQILSRHHLVTRQHQNTFELDQAMQYALGAEELARQALYDDFVNSGPGVDTLEEFWASSALPFDLDGVGVMQAYVVDMHRCFNLNSLAGSQRNENHQRLQNLLSRLGLAPELADLIKDWVDADLEVTGLGAEDATYLLSQPAYLTPNQPMVDISEVDMLADVETAQLQALAQETCIRPDTSLNINVNTASARTLSALDPGLTDEEALAITQESRNFLTVDDFISVYPSFAAAGLELSVTSEYFTLVGQAQLNSSRVSLRSLLQRDTENGQIHLLQRDFGKRFRTNYLAAYEAEST
jgi:general secretion pathway protein K